MTAIFIIFLISPTLTFAASENKASSKSPNQTIKKDVVCPDRIDVAMMGGMGGMGMGTAGGMGAMGMGTAGGTQGTLGGMGAGGMGAGGMGTMGTGGMGTMTGMGNMAAITESDNNTMAPNGALSHSPCSKNNSDNNIQ